GGNELRRQARRPPAAEGDAEEAAAGEHRRAHDATAPARGLRRGALPADGPAQDRALLASGNGPGGPRLQAAQEPARGRTHLPGRGHERVLADRGEHLELGADPAEPVLHARPPWAEVPRL